MASLRQSLDSMRLAIEKEYANIETQRVQVEKQKENAEALMSDARRIYTDAENARHRVMLELEGERERMAVYKVGELIDLDVGGEHLRTFRSTLVNAGGLLEAMFSGRHEPRLTPEGRHFIDFEASLFRRLLAALRLGTLAHAAQTDDLLHTTAEYFQVNLH